MSELIEAVQPRIMVNSPQIASSVTPVTKVKDAGFSDLYLGSKYYWFKGIPGKRNPEPASEELHHELREMYESFRKEHAKLNKKDFGMAHDGISYRASVMPSLSGDVFVLRKLASTVPHLQELGINHQIVKALTAPDATGLILISGAPSQGKTTTASAIIKSRLMQYGGVAITGEDPPEMPLEGEHEKGICYQTIADDEAGGYTELAKLLVRWNPDLILYGEIRDKDVAAEALKASISGRLVVSTVHADDVVSTLSRITSLAKNMDSTNANSLLAAGLYGVINQKLITNNDGKLLIINEHLFVNDNNRMQIRKLISEDRTAQLVSEIQAQKNQLITGAVRK